MKVINVHKLDNTLPSKFINDEGLKTVVINGQIATSLIYQSEFSNSNYSILNSTKPFFLGSLAGIRVYVDPDLSFDNNTITLVENLEEYEKYKY